MTATVLTSDDDDAAWMLRRHTVRTKAEPEIRERMLPVAEAFVTMAAELSHAQFNNALADVVASLRDSMDGRGIDADVTDLSAETLVALAYAKRGAVMTR